MTILKSRSLTFLCIIGYMVFMILAFDSSIVDALVFYVSEQEGRTVLMTGEVITEPIIAQASETKPIVAVRFKGDRKGCELPVVKYAFRTEQEKKDCEDAKTALDTTGLAEIAGSTSLYSEASSGEKSEASVAKPPAMKSGKASPEDLLSPVSSEPAKSMSAVTGTEALSRSMHISDNDVKEPASNLENSDGKSLSILSLLKSLPQKTWSFDSKLNRYVVQYDSDTTLILSIRPGVQKILERAFDKYSMEIGVGIIQDPRTGAILAMVAKDGKKLMKPGTKVFPTQENWALKSRFPIASIFKVVTAAAGLQEGKITTQSRIVSWKKNTMPVWEAFAKSHNGVFGRIAQRVGRLMMQQYADSFGFNKQFFFDLPVEQSSAVMPSNQAKLGQAAAGLNKYFQVSPVHVSAIISSVLNNGRMMKPYLVDYVMHKGEVVFRRKAFRIGTPMKEEVARDIFEMMTSTNTHGTGKRGFSGYGLCPELPQLTGGKTGTLTGADPKLLFTWYGGYTRTAGRDLTIVTLCGRKGRGGTRAASIAGQICYDFFAARNPSPALKPHMVSMGE